MILLPTKVVTQEKITSEPAWQLCNIGVDLFFMLHKLMHADALGFLEHVCDVESFLLSCGVGKHGEKVEHHAVIE